MKRDRGNIISFTRNPSMGLSLSKLCRTGFESVLVTRRAKTATRTNEKREKREHLCPPSSHKCGNHD